jgi:formate dehydrogenase beta subunit
MPDGRAALMDGDAKPARRRPRLGPRGRTADQAALAAVRTALGPLPLRRDLLIEHLHALTEAEGCLREGQLVALAELLRLAPVEVFEVASFYAHFEILPDAAAPPPGRTIRVCDGLPCAMAGAEALLAALQAEPPPDGMRVLRAPCMGGCDRAPMAALGHTPLPHATAERIRAADPPPPAPASAVPIGADDYALLREAPATATLLDALERSGLRGMGGAGFPAARKWRLVLDQPGGTRHLVVNADEGEPGTFKDRFLLETAPHRVLEGMLLAAFAIEATACWIYLRDEYADLLPALGGAIAAAEEAGLTGGIPIHLRRGAGAYIVGEETALLESLEGKRGWPRHKPPFPGERGLFGAPTLIHNVETLWWLPEVLRDPEGYAAEGRRSRRGARLISLSGRVRAPGVVRAPAGVTARELVEEFGGGMPEGQRFAAYLPGGASGGILPESMADLPLDFGTLEPHGCFVGSGAVVILSDRDDLAEAARNLLRFFRDESCGQCTPCRVGTAKAVAMLETPAWDRALLEELAQVMADGSICGLGQAAMNPVRSLLRFLPESVP